MKTFVQVRFKGSSIDFSRGWEEEEVKEYEFKNREAVSAWARTTVELLPNLEIRLSYPTSSNDRACDLSGSYHTSKQWI